ncbi:MAG: GMC family oxidoreductase [Burkholderiales bacterium]
MTSAKFDYIVVGAGSAGCVLAARLSEDASKRVLLLEAGRHYRHPYMRMPAAFYMLMDNASLMWDYQSQPEPFADNRSLPLHRGRLLGGTGAINGMTYARGAPADYDDWVTLGATGWSYIDVLPYFKKSERNWRGETAYHGGAGPMGVTQMKVDGDPLYEAFMAMAKAKGHKTTDDYCGEHLEGFARIELTTYKGHRSSTAEGFLLPAMGRPNLTVMANSPVQRILFHGDRAIGVECLQRGQLHQFYSEREVVLSGGSYNSPQMLMLAGIGRPDELRAAGVKPFHELMGVGQNLQDHNTAHMLYAASKPITFHRELRFDRAALSVLRWWFTGTGPMAQMPLTCWAARKSLPELDRPDITFFVSPVALADRVWIPGLRKGAGHKITARNTLRDPESRGAVRLASANPNDAPMVLANLLKEHADVRTFTRALRQTREMMASEPVASLIEKELLPGPACQSDADFETYLRKSARTSCHPCGTCAMGRDDDPNAVLDARLRVRGLKGLRVADASVMPRIPGGNLNAPTIMVAEKAADLIKEDA